MIDPIETPRGTVIVGENGKAELKFNPNFGPKWTRKYSDVQKVIDSEVLRGCEPFIPLRTGTLIKTGILGTDIGSGTVKWIAPYAAKQYYQGRAPGTSQEGPLRGRFWFERWKQLNSAKLITKAKAMMG